MYCLLGGGGSKSPHIYTGSIQENDFELSMDNDQITSAYARITTNLFNELNRYLDNRKNQLQNRWRRLFIRKKLTDYRIREIAQPLQTSLAQYFPSSKNKNVRSTNRNAIRFTVNDFISPNHLLSLRELKDLLTENIRRNNIETRRYFFAAGTGKLQQIMEVALRNLSDINIPDETLNSDPLSFLSDKSIDLK